MHKSNFSSEITKLATVPQAMERYKLSRNQMMKFAKSENALIRFGRSVRIDVCVLDEAIRKTLLDK